LIWKLNIYSYLCITNHEKWFIVLWKIWG